jgi:hypothetical protein
MFSWKNIILLSVVLQKHLCSISVFAAMSNDDGKTMSKGGIVLMDGHCIIFSFPGAVAGEDFQILSPLDPDAPLEANLEINSTTTSFDISFEILEDPVFEMTEFFMASLSLFIFTPNVGIGPGLNVMITDNEGTARALTFEVCTRYCCTKRLYLGPLCHCGQSTHPIRNCGTSEDIIQYSLNFVHLGLTSD